MIGNNRWILGLLVLIVAIAGFIIFDSKKSRKENKSQPKVESAFTSEIKTEPSSCSNPINETKAKEIVSQLPDVKDFLARMEKANVETIIEAVKREGPNDFSVQVAGWEQDHTVSFNGYILDGCTGALKCSFVIYNRDDNGGFERVRVSEPNEFPCD